MFNIKTIIWIFTNDSSYKVLWDWFQLNQTNSILYSCILDSVGFVPSSSYGGLSFIFCPLHLAFFVVTNSPNFVLDSSSCAGDYSYGTLGNNPTIRFHHRIDEWSCRFHSLAALLTTCNIRSNNTWPWLSTSSVSSSLFHYLMVIATCLPSQKEVSSIYSPPRIDEKFKLCWVWVEAPHAFSYKSPTPCWLNNM